MKAILVFILFTKLYPNYPEVKFIFTYPPVISEPEYGCQQYTDLVSCLSNTNAKSTGAIITGRLYLLLFLYFIIM